MEAPNILFNQTQMRSERYKQQALGDVAGVLNMFSPVYNMFSPVHNMFSPVHKW